MYARVVPSLGGVEHCAFYFIDVCVMVWMTILLKLSPGSNPSLNLWTLSNSASRHAIPPDRDLYWPQQASAKYARGGDWDAEPLLCLIKISARSRSQILCVESTDRIAAIKSGHTFVEPLSICVSAGLQLSQKEPGRGGLTWFLSRHLYLFAT